MQLARFLCPFKDKETEAQTLYMTYGWSQSHQVPRFQTLCWQSCHLHPQAWLPLNTLMSLGQKKKKEEKRASCLTLESRPRVFCHSPQSIRGMLPSFLVSSNPSQSGGRGHIHQSQAPVSISHHLPSRTQILDQQGEQTGWVWGLIVPVQILWTSILLSSISGLLLKGTWHLHFQAFSEILQQTSTSWPPSLQAPRFPSLDQQSSY